MSELAKVEPAEVMSGQVDPMVSMIERIAMDPNSDLAKLEKMLDMKERLEQAQAKAMFAEAFAIASAEFPTIPLRGKGHNDKPYATLEDITKLTRPALSGHGLALTFSIDVQDQVVVTAKLMHRAGHVESTSIALPRDTSGSKNAVQAVGSTQKYGQRYAAQAILGLSLGEDDEDDGRSSGPAHQEQQKPKYSWAATVTQDMPADATPRQKAEAISGALCAQFRRMNGVKQIDNEWDRRAVLISELESRHQDLWGKVIEAYDVRRHDLAEAQAEKEKM